MASALVSMLIRLPKLKFVIVTLGEEGCIMLQRSHNGEGKLKDSRSHFVLFSFMFHSLFFGVSVSIFVSTYLSKCMIWA